MNLWVNVENTSYKRYSLWNVLLSNYSVGSPSLPVCSPSLPVRSLWIPLRSPLYSICDHHAFSMRSQSVYFALAFVQCSLIVQSNNIIFRLITIHTIFFFITDETQCKDNSWGTPNKSFMLRSHDIHILFMVHSLCVHYSFVLVFALCVCLSFTVHMHSLLAQSALTVGS